MNIDGLSQAEHMARLEPLIAMKQFEMFVKSSYFAVWEASLRANTAAIATEETVLNDHSSIPVVNDKSGMDAATMEYHRSIILRIDRGEFHEILRNQCWLSELLVMAHTLPVPFTVATANVKRSGFPLVYVNPAFELLTGYTKEEVVGHNCAFLQKKSSPEMRLCDALSIAKMKKALSVGMPEKVLLRNFRKDGSMFYNQVLLKPIFDQFGYYRYVIGLQFLIDPEVGSTLDGSPTAENKTNDFLFRLIPDQLFIDEHEFAGEYLNENL